MFTCSSLLVFPKVSLPSTLPHQPDPLDLHLQRDRLAHVVHGQRRHRRPRQGLHLHARGAGSLGGAADVNRIAGLEEKAAFQGQLS